MNLNRRRDNAAGGRHNHQMCHAQPLRQSAPSVCWSRIDRTAASECTLSNRYTKLATRRGCACSIWLRPRPPSCRITIRTIVAEQGLRRATHSAIQHNTKGSKHRHCSSQLRVNMPYESFLNVIRLILATVDVDER